MAEGALPDVRVAHDDRGRLVAVEFDGLPFVPQRTFVVTSETAPVTRGGHVADCREVIVLVAGRIELRMVGRGEAWITVLDTPGASVEVGPEDYIDYDLMEPGSTIMVLADRPYSRLSTIEEL
jgi:hypothetical protein